MIGPPGISMALGNGPLDEPPTWTRIDNIAGLLVESISINRGRPDERNKVSPSQVSIKGTDTAGVLDPTNSSSPLAAGLGPIKQMAVSLYRPDLAEWHWLVRGHNANINLEMDVSNRWSKFEITFTCALDIINDAEIIPDDAGTAVPGESQGDCFYTGQHVDDRLLAVLADASTAFAGQTWPASLIQLASGNVFVQGRAYSARTSMLQVVDEACDAEYPFASNRYMTRDGAFRFSGRFYRFTPETFLVATDADRHDGARLVQWNVGDATAVSGDATIVNVNGIIVNEGKDNLINAALVTPFGIPNNVLANNTDGNFVSDPTSIADYGVRTSGMSFENLIIGDADDDNTYIQEAASFSDAIVNNYKDPVPYIQEFTLKNPSPGDSDTQKTAVWDFLTGVELSDMVHAETHHPGGGGFNVSTGVEQYHFIENLNYEIGALQGDEWMVTLKVGMSSRHHYRYMPSSWSVLTGGAGGGGGERFVASFSMHPSTGVAPLDVTFTDTSAGATTWDWDFGDGSAHGTTGGTFTHTYDSPGTYTILLTAHDLAGDVSTYSRTIIVH